MKSIEEKAKAYDEAKRHKKVLFADLDGTLIDYGVSWYSSGI